MRFLQSLAIELEKFVHLYLIIRNSESYFLFYLIFFLQPISGYLVTNLQGDTVMFFNIELTSIIGVDRDLRFIFRQMHEYTSNVVLVLFFIHSGAALMHHFIFKDHTLKRMMFSKK